MLTQLDTDERRSQSAQNNPFMKSDSKICAHAPGLAVQNPGVPSLKVAFKATNIAPLAWASRSQECARRQESSLMWASESDECSSIYIVDDEPRLTDLYAVVLEGKGYAVRAFNNRAEALASLKGDRRKPDLLIMDYLGHTMPVDQFMQRCLLAHPALRILMATGLSQVDRQFCYIRPDRILQKPFTAEEFLREVKAALAV
jgi:CheY-like chemotaxis protein